MSAPTRSIATARTGIDASLDVALRPRRAASRFPGAAPDPTEGLRPVTGPLPRDAGTPAEGGSGAGITVRWCGEDGDLRRRVRDHVEAGGGHLLEDHEDASPHGTDLIIGTPGALDAQLPSRGAVGTAAPRILAVQADGAVPEEDWSVCLRLGAIALVRLPSESERLLSLLGDSQSPRGGSLMIGVLGGCGGAGASSMAARLAGAWARRGASVVLVDADPLGGGLDLLVESPPSTGGAWEDVGHLDIADGERLRAGLPLVDGVRLLCSRGVEGPEPARAAAALASLSPLDGTVVVDLATSHVPAALPHLDRLLMVVPGTDHAVRSAMRRLPHGDGARPRTGVIVRRRTLTPSEVAGDLGLPLVGSFRDSSPGSIPLLDVRRGGADRLAGRLAMEEARAWTS